MSSQDSLFVYDKEELLRSLERFDGTVTVEDVTDSIKCDSSRYVHTSFTEVLLEYICAGIVKNDTLREILLAEVCRKLSQLNLINEDLLLHTRPLRKELSKRFYDFIRKTCEEVIPEADLDLSTISVLENSASFRNIYKAHFEELQEIGRGGFGVVCKAKYILTDSLYAIKKIFFKYKNDSRLRRVVREAKNIAALNHPNVVHYNNAWTEAPTPEDDLYFSSSDDKDSDSNSASDNFSCKVSYCSEDVRKVKDNEFSFESTYFRSMKCSYSKCPRSEKDKNTSYSENSDSIIFSDFPGGTNRNITLPPRYDCENQSDQSLNHEHYLEKNDVTESIDQADFKNCCSISETDSDENDDDDDDDSVNLDVKAILYIQMEYCDCDLRHWLVERAEGNPLPFDMDILNIFINILNGVVHIHSKGIIHRDLKPQNIFYSVSTNTLKIGDFGLATLAVCPDVPDSGATNVHSTNIGTLPYAAPEQIKYQSYDSKVDIYSLGIILLELLNNCSTVMELTEIINKVKKGSFPKNMEDMPKLMHLVKNLVRENPEDRMSAKEILNYLQEDSKIALEKREKALQEKEIRVNERERQVALKEAALKEKEDIIKLREADLKKKEEDIMKLREAVLKEKEDIMKSRETALKEL